jgi:DNA-binding HxlR family transcriptional regulator
MPLNSEVVASPNIENGQAAQCAQINAPVDPHIAALVNDLIGRVADKWTMVILEVLDEHDTLRFSRLAALVDGISQKMLTKTLRQMERDGLLTRHVHPVIPPHVDYCLTDIGRSLGAAFCGVWVWAADHHDAVQRARENFDAQKVVQTPP